MTPNLYCIINYLSIYCQETNMSNSLHKTGNEALASHFQKFQNRLGTWLSRKKVTYTFKRPKKSLSARFAVDLVTTVQGNNPVKHEVVSASSFGENQNASYGCGGGGG